MISRPTKVVVAMSGGVDSSVAALLLREQGYDVIGLFMRTGNPASKAPPVADLATSSGAVALPVAQPARNRQGCCSASDAADARYVAGQLGVPFYVLDFEKDFSSLVDYFAEEYVNGRTPNPCIVCNSRLKFGRILEYADAMDSDFIATGHYAALSKNCNEVQLLRPADKSKDQSYVLFGVSRNALSRALFPLGGLLKSQVRDIARRSGFPNADKPDSVEICFVPDQNYASIVLSRRPDRFQTGDVVDASGARLGSHDGIGRFTVGQRRGLGIAAGHPLYVTRLDPATNTVTVGPSTDLLRADFFADKVNFLVDDAPSEFRAHVKIRYLHDAQPAKVIRTAPDVVHVCFDEPQRAITPGQAAVMYDGDVVVGGGWIR